MPGPGRRHDMVPGHPSTIRDVARLAGISKSAAARVMSGQGYASAELRGAVLAAAEALGSVYRKMGIDFHLHVGPIASQGARVVASA